MIDIVLFKLLEVAGLSFLHATYDEILTHRRKLLSVVSNAVVLRNRKLRVSIAEILRLTQKDRYVLIQNKRRPDRYAPIGGVVHCFPSGLRLLQEEFGFEPESLSGEDHLDLRGFMKGNYFPKLLKWFYAGSGRERGALSRELAEELREISLTSAVPLVNGVEFSLVRIVHEGPAEVPGTDYLQYRLFLVQELVHDHPPSRILAEAILGSLPSTSQLAAVSAAQITRGRTSDGAFIADSAGYLFGDKRVRPELPP